MAYFKLFVFILIALVAVTFTNAQNNTGGQSAENVVKDDKSSLEKGMEPIFSLYHNFLTTVMSKSFYASDTPFNVQKLNKIVKDEDYSELQTNWKDLVATYGGIAACIICGLLFLVFMPLIGLIYCCCHCCCHKCGGTRETRDPKRAGCLRITFSALLLICATLVLVGCIITFLGSELLKRSLKNENDEGLVSSMDSNLAALQIFANSTTKEVKDEATQKIMIDGLGEILPRIESSVNHTVDRVKNLINATQLLNAADDLGKEAKKALSDIEDIRISLSNLTTLQTTVDTKLTKVRNDVDSECIGASQCPETSGLKFNPDFSNLDDLQAQLDNTEQAQDIDTYVQQARNEFSNVSDDVGASVQSSIQDAKTEIEDINSTVARNVNDLNGIADPFVDSLQEGRDFVDDKRNLFTDIANYVWYACIGMGCAVLLVVLFYYLGILFGLCGERPGFNAACCNRGTGANLLCAGIFFSFLFAALLMLVVILMFTLGGLGYTMACQYLNKGVENVDVFETVLSDGLEWNVSQSFGVSNLTIGGMMRNCKADQGIYTALHLDSIFNIDKEFNVTDVKRQVREMTDKSFVLRNITLLTPDLLQQLDSFKGTGISTVNYTQYTEQLNKTLIGADLSTIITELESLARQPSLSQLNDSAQELRDLQNNELHQIEEEKRKLQAAVASLEKHSDVSAEVDSLIANIQNAENRFNIEKDVITKMELQNAVDDILTLIDDKVSSTKIAIKNDIGKCEPLYTAFQNVADTVCISTLDPFNAIWFGLGWSLFFYIPCLVFAALLSSLYQRSEKYVDKNKFDDIAGGYPAYGGGHNEDILPLTSGGDRRDRPNGNYNRGYEVRESVPESRYHRDGNYPDAYGQEGSSRHVYDMPTRDSRSRYPPHDSPPQYDEAIGHRYTGHDQRGGRGYQY